MGHVRDYSEEIAALVDEEVRQLVEAAHHEAWEILVEYRDVLDDMVLRLLDKETLSKDEVAQVFAPIAKRPQRPHPTGLGKRPLDDRPPVLTPAELAVLGPADLEDLARGRTGRPKPATRRRPGNGSVATGSAAGSKAGNGNGNGSTQPARGRAGVRRAAAPVGEGTRPRSASGQSPTPRRRRAAGSDPAS